MTDNTSYPAPPLYFLAGAVAGAGVALLLAPQAGRLTRRMINRRLRDAATSARDLKDDVVRQCQELRDEGALRFTEAASALTGRS
jgi:gas vesicle protein